MWYFLCCIDVFRNRYRGVTTGVQGGYNSPGAESLWWRQMTARAPKSPNNITNTFFNTVHLVPKDLGFEHEGRVKLASCPGRHLTSLRLWTDVKPYCNFSFQNKVFVSSFPTAAGPQPTDIFGCDYNMLWYLITEHIFENFGGEELPGCQSSHGFRPVRQYMLVSKYACNMLGTKAMILILWKSFSFQQVFLTVLWKNPTTITVDSWACVSVIEVSSSRIKVVDCGKQQPQRESQIT